MGITCFDANIMDEEKCRVIGRECLDLYPKLSYQVVSKFGDYYYKPMPKAEAY